MINKITIQKMPIDALINFINEVESSKPSSFRKKEAKAKILVEKYRAELKRRGLEKK